MRLRLRLDIWIDVDSEIARLHQKVPHTARLVDVNLDEITGLSPTKFTASACVLTHKGLFNDEIWLREDAERRTQCLFGWRE